MVKRLVIAIVLLAVLVAPAPADVRLSLKDGRVLDGRDVWREGTDYVLQTGDGDTLVIPEAFVAEVRIMGETAPDEAEPEAEAEDAWRARSGVVSGPARTLGGSDPVEGAPTGIDRSTGPRTLAGEPVRPPRTSEQLEVFGESAGFQKDVVRNDWQPTTDWDMNKGVNDWAPSTWSKGVSDPTWRPDSAYRADNNVMQGSESQWQRSVVDSSWSPRSGFAD